MSISQQISGMQPDTKQAWGNSGLFIPGLQDLLGCPPLRCLCTENQQQPILCSVKVEGSVECMTRTFVHLALCRTEHVPLADFLGCRYQA